MFTVEVACPCGYRSDSAVWGVPASGSLRIGVPVFTQNKLIQHFLDPTSTNPDGADLWVAANLFRIVAETYGPEAIVAIPGNESGPLRCPQCGKSTAQPQWIGII